MPYNDLRRALNYGPTVAVRFFIVLASGFQALRMWIGAVEWAEPPVTTLWGLAYFTVAFFGLWRLVDTRPRPLCGWVTNSLACAVWGAGLVACAMLDLSLALTPYSTVVIMAMWCLLRTEATSNDTGTT